MFAAGKITWQEPKTFAMNGALISIGIFKPTLRQKANETAQRIGKVEVDHGESNCKTLAAVAYIAEASQRKRYQ